MAAKTCSKPREWVPGKPVPCGKCDFCIGRRANTWTARAMMEKASTVDTLVLTLTYGSDSDAAIDGAKQFHYAHVRLFMQNLRDHVDAKLGWQGGLRFLVCGETGDRFKRVHWHVVLFSQTDLAAIGEWRAPWGVVTERRFIVTADGGRKQPRQWSLWPHGTVFAQEPDRGGLRYALSYVVKDAFALDNAEGTARQGSAEFDAAGYFRPSKGRPIGMPFVEAHLAACAAAGRVHPDTRLDVPGLDFPVSALGRLRERLLLGYRQINLAHRAEHGSNCAAWSSLVYNLRNDDKAMAWLGILPPEDVDKRKNCGSSMPCDECLSALSDQARARLHTVALDSGDFVLSSDYRRLADDAGEPPAPGSPLFRDWLSAVERFGRLQSDGSRKAVHPVCQLRGSKLLNGCFADIGGSGGDPVLSDRRFVRR